MKQMSWGNMIKIKKLFLMSLLIIIFAPGCMNSGYKSIEEAIQYGGIQYKQIYHQHEVDNGVIVFLENMGGGMDAGIVYKHGDRYEWGFGGGSVSFPSKEEKVTWAWVNLDSNVRNNDKRHQLYYGIIKVSEIATLHIEHKGPVKYINKDADIVELFSGNRLWFALQDEYSEFHPGFTLTGMNKDGESVFHFE